MDTPSPTPASDISSTVPAPGLFGSKVPPVVAFLTAVLLFFLPFVDIRCNNMSLQQVSGIELATGFKMKSNTSGNSFLDDVKKESSGEDNVKSGANPDKENPNLFALVALALGVLGLGLSFTNARTALAGAAVTGIASAGSLVWMMIDLKKKAKIDMPSTGNADSGLGNLGEKMNISIDFTPWFYISVVAFLAAAFFSYRRMRTRS